MTGTHTLSSTDEVLTGTKIQKSVSNLANNETQRKMHKNPKTNESDQKHDRPSVPQETTAPSVTQLSTSILSASMNQTNIALVLPCDEDTRLPIKQHNVSSNMSTDPQELSESEAGTMSSPFVKAHRSFLDPEESDAIDTLALDNLDEYSTVNTPLFNGTLPESLYGPYFETASFFPMLDPNTAHLLQSEEIGQNLRRKWEHAQMMPVRNILEMSERWKLLQSIAMEFEKVVLSFLCPDQYIVPGLDTAHYEFPHVYEGIYICDVVSPVRVKLYGSIDLARAHARAEIRVMRMALSSPIPITGLSIPLCGMFEYGTHPNEATVFAHALMPISKDSLLYGDMNGLFQNQHAHVCYMTARLAELFLINRVSGAEETARIPLSVKIALGENDRKYLIDAAHLLFSAKYTENMHMEIRSNEVAKLLQNEYHGLHRIRSAHLSIFMRPEFQLSYSSNPLIFHNQQKAIMEANYSISVCQTLVTMQNILIPRVVSWFNREAIRCGSDLCRVLHAHGINLRYMGQVACELKSKSISNVGKHALNLIEIEIQARTIKSLLRSTPYAHRLDVTEVLYNVFSGCKNKDDFWDKQIIPRMKLKFGYTCCTVLEEEKLKNPSTIWETTEGFDEAKTLDPSQYGHRMTSKVPIEARQCLAGKAKFELTPIRTQLRGTAYKIRLERETVDSNAASHPLVLLMGCQEPVNQSILARIGTLLNFSITSKRKRSSRSLSSIWGPPEMERGSRVGVEAGIRIRCCMPVALTTGFEIIQELITKITVPQDGVTLPCDMHKIHQLVDEAMCAFRSEHNANLIYLSDQDVRHCRMRSMEVICRKDAGLEWDTELKKLTDLRLRWKDPAAKIWAGLEAAELAAYRSRWALAEHYLEECTQEAINTYNGLNPINLFGEICLRIAKVLQSFGSLHSLRKALEYLEVAIVATGCTNVIASAPSLYQYAICIQQWNAMQKCAVCSCSNVPYSTETENAPRVHDDMIVLLEGTASISFPVAHVCLKCAEDGPPDSVLDMCDVLLADPKTSTPVSHNRKASSQSRPRGGKKDKLEEATRQAALLAAATVGKAFHIPSVSLSNEQRVSVKTLQNSFSRDSLVRKHRYLCDQCAQALHGERKQTVEHANHVLQSIHTDELVILTHIYEILRDVDIGNEWYPFPFGDVSFVHVCRSIALLNHDIVEAKKALTIARSILSKNFHHEIFVLELILVDTYVSSVQSGLTYIDKQIDTAKGGLQIALQQKASERTNLGNLIAAEDALRHLLKHLVERNSLWESNPIQTQYYNRHYAVFHECLSYILRVAKEYGDANLMLKQQTFLLDVYHIAESEFNTSYSAISRILRHAVAHFLVLLREKHLDKIIQDVDLAVRASTHSLEARPSTHNSGGDHVSSLSMVQTKTLQSLHNPMESISPHVLIPRTRVTLADLCIRWLRSSINMYTVSKQKSTSIACYVTQATSDIRYILHILLECAIKPMVMGDANDKAKAREYTTCVTTLLNPVPDIPLVDKYVTQMVELISVRQKSDDDNEILLNRAKLQIAQIRELGRTLRKLCRQWHMHMNSKDLYAQKIWKDLHIIVEKLQCIRKKIKTTGYESTGTLSALENALQPYEDNFRKILTDHKDKHKS